MTDNLHRALQQWDAAAFAKKHGGYKESASKRSFEWLYTCPRCASSRLRYNSKKHTWICWGCRLTGDTLFLIQLFERVTERGAIEYVMSGYVGGDARIDHLDTFIQPTAARPGAAWGSVRRIPPRPWPKGVDLLVEPCAPHWMAWDYLVRVRGLTKDQVRDYGLGFGRYGWLKDYIVFPCYMDHSLAYWQGRATWDPPSGLTKEERKAWAKAADYQKTRNPVASEGEEYATAHEAIFNYDRASACEHVVICEGPIDAIKTGPNAVALLGKLGASEDVGLAKIDRLTRMTAMRYTIYLDAGEEELQAAHHIASELEPFGQVFIVQPPQGYDPGSLTPEQNAEIIKQAKPFRTDFLSSSLK